MNEEILRKAREAESAEELLEIAKANGFDISEEDAKDIFARLNSDGELADGELEAVSGGCGDDSEWAQKSGKTFTCPSCGRRTLVATSRYFLCVHCNATFDNGKK